MSYQPVSVLAVTIWGRRVGAIAATRRGDGYQFEFDRDWLDSGLELAPILMPLAARRPLYVFRSARGEETFRGLPPMLADSVPDRFGNALIDARLARDGVTADAVTPLDRLAYVGRRGMGALEYVPDRGPREPDATALELADLVVAARAAVEGRLDEDGATDSLNDLLMVGTSAGGARPKAVLAWNRATGEIRPGGIPVPPDFEQWLLKFDGVRGEGSGQGRSLGSPEGYGRIEYAYAEMARDAGIAVAPTHLLEEGGRAHFMTKRFDRVGSDRLHMQTLCAISGVDFNLVQTNDYASYMTAINEIGLGAEDRREAFRRIAFNVLGSNNDDHSKNFSFLMGPDGRWRMSPAYDVTYAYLPGNRWLESHLLAVEGKFVDITRGDLEVFADRYAVPRARETLDQVAAAIEQWPVHADAAGVPAGRKEEIQRRLRAVSIA